MEPDHFSYYGYDYTGERTLKLTGKCSLIDVNADFMTVASTLDNVTLYTSPYMVCTEKGYTKHIYAGTERLCAKRGGGGFGTMAQLLGTDAVLQGNTKDLFLQVIDDMRDRHLPLTGCAEPLPVDAESAPGTVKAEVDADPTQLTVALENHRTSIHQETDRYFYHSDHLGSASWITDATGTAIQHLQYCPYGEPFVDQHTGNYMERFTFTGKERDEETGYHYFGARYLDADWMTGWLSVDPMGDKEASMSPYAYCFNNSIKLKDPDGLWPWETTQHKAERKALRSGGTAVFVNDSYHWEVWTLTVTLEPMQQSADDMVVLGCWGKYAANVIYEHRNIRMTLRDRVERLESNIHEFSLSKFAGKISRLEEGFSDAAENVAVSLVTWIPPVGLTNDVLSILGDQDMFGFPVEAFDKGVSVMDIVSLGANRVVKSMCKNEVLQKGTNVFSKVPSVITSIKNVQNETKDKKQNAQESRF